MKIRLVEEKDGIHILHVSGEMTAHHYLVLQSGIIKLFRLGKNRIIVELGEVKILEQEVIRGLAVLNINAREMRGDIVLAGVGPEIRAKIENFARPPVIVSFAQLEDALRYFRDPDYRVQIDEGGKFRHLLEEKDARILELERRVGQADVRAVEQLKSENEELKKQKLAVEGKLAELSLARPQLPDREALEEKIRVLEERLREAAAPASSAPVTPAARA